jgi:hypothetical protein
MSAEVHVGDVNTRFLATLKDQDTTVVDITSATVMKFKFRKPSGTVVERTASRLNAGDDGKMKYDSITNDLDEAGEWIVQGYVEVGSGKWHTDPFQFTVYPVLVVSP